MAEETINFDTARLQEYTVFAQRVYLRERWSDDWEEQENLFATEVIWNAAPEMPTATLLWRYGRGMLAGEAALAIKERLAKSRWFVKIEIDGQFVQGGSSDKLTWHGTLEVEADHWAGVRDEPPATEGGQPEPFESGTQELIAHGLELLLARTPVIESVYYDDVVDTERRIGRGLAFNAGGKPNRTSAPFDDRYLFSVQTPPNVQYWYTRAAVEYLLLECAPRAANGASILNWKVDPDFLAQLPNWDRIGVETHGKSVFDVLNELIPRQRLMGWTLAVDPDTDDIWLRPFTFAHEDIDVGEGNKLLANTRLRKVVLDRGPGEAVAIKTSAAEQFDQIVVQGRRRRICFSVCHDNDTLELGWKSADETAYEAGASTAGDYPAATEIEDRRRRDADARAAHKLSEVYARYKLPAAWDYHVGDPVAGGAAELFIVPEQGELPYPLECFLMPTLPLLSNRDYSGTKIEDDTVGERGDAPAVELVPCVYFPIPEDTSRYVRGDQIATVAALANYDSRRDFSVSVRVADNSRAVEVLVQGGPQHLIATADFTGLAHDYEPGNESWFDWQDMVLTLAIEEDRFAEARWPSDDTMALLISGPAEDAVRRKVIDAGNSYRLDWIVKGTIVEVEATTGEPVQVEVDDGDGAFINDDRPALEAVARVAHAWYGTPRKALTFSSRRVGSALQIGDLITTLGEAFPVEIRSVVTQMQVTIPRVEGASVGEPGPTSIEYTTAYAELDPLQLAPRART